MKLKRIQNRRRAVKYFVLAFVASSTVSVAATFADLKMRLEWANISELGSTFSVYSYGQSPYNRSAPFLKLEDRQRFSDGSIAFNKNHSGTAATKSDGTPVVSNNAATCGLCHFKDGRGQSHSEDPKRTGFSVLEQEKPPEKMFFRNPAHGDSNAILLPEIQWRIEEQIAFPDGETVELVRPVVEIDGEEKLVDLRNAPGVYGLGLIEAVSGEEIVSLAQSRRYARFGVLGKAALLEGQGSEPLVGRFGWKGSHATLPDQIRSALRNELGITSTSSSDSSDKLATNQAAYADLVEELTNYVRLLAVPARRVDESEGLKKGAALFDDVGCAMCHKPSWETDRSAKVSPDFRGLRIYPFTDLLLHDLGPGLGAPGHGELGQYWQTPPLWGIGVQESVSSKSGYLHDGRARDFSEAILWHGGEAKFSVNSFKSLSAAERSSLIIFLSSL